MYCHSNENTLHHLQLSLCFCLTWCFSCVLSDACDIPSESTPKGSSDHKSSVQGARPLNHSPHSLSPSKRPQKQCSGSQAPESQLPQSFCVTPSKQRPQKQCSRSQAPESQLPQSNPF